jgi:hypothetical protein
MGLYDEWVRLEGELVEEEYEDPVLKDDAKKFYDGYDAVDDENLIDKIKPAKENKGNRFFNENIKCT